MPDTMALKDGTVEVIFQERDFEELIDKHMGYEAARYFRGLMEELEAYREEDADYDK